MGTKIPFSSKAQEKYLFAKHPEIASKWQKEYPEQKAKQLPEHVAPKPKPVRSPWDNMSKKI